MFCQECIVEYDDNDGGLLTHCPLCGSLLIASAFAEPVIDDEEIDFDDDDFD